MAMISTVAKKGQRKNLYKKLERLDLVGKLEPLFRSGIYHFRPSDGKIVRGSAAMAHNTPWVFIKTLERRCDLAHNVFYRHYEFIPSFCQKCWKIVVRPRNLIELFDLYELMKVLDLESKCGIEPRDSVNGLYGGYFYTTSKSQGKRRYKIVRAHVSEWLSPQTSVILKRYCTEFELKFGPSDETKPLTEEQKFIEDYCQRHMPFEGVGHPQPEPLQASVMRQWIHYAYKNGDQTYKEFITEPLYKPLVTYHEEVK